MTKIFLVRHAEPNYANHEDSLRELSEKGLRDRRMVTNYLKDKEIDVVVSSPYRRAIETIEEFAENAGLEIETMDGFRERKIDDQWIDDYESFSRKQWGDFSYKLPGGECLQEVQDRNICALMKTVKKYRGKNIVIGSHGTAISTILHYFDNTFDYERFKNVKDKMPWIVEIDMDDAANHVAIHPVEDISGEIGQKSQA